MERMNKTMSRMEIWKLLHENAKERGKDYEEALRVYGKALYHCGELRELIQESCDYPLEPSLIAMITDLLDIIESRLDFAGEWLTDDIEHNNEYIKSLEKNIEGEEETSKGGQNGN